uniref:C-type lectin domain-containing protein n=1 Tax=Astyanax mexicanus TaxID=7994 RepID=A0A3B1K7V9_ASTMX
LDVVFDFSYILALIVLTLTLCLNHNCCQDGWLQFKSHCFKVFTTNENFKTSEENCVSAGGHLASMHSNADNVFIKDLVWNTTNSNAVTWIGARDAGQLGKWVWTDGSAFDYSIWSNGQPDKHSPLEQCVEINYLGTVFQYFITVLKS